MVRRRARRCLRASERPRGSGEKRRYRISPIAAASCQDPSLKRRTTPRTDVRCALHCVACVRSKAIAVTPAFAASTSRGSVRAVVLCAPVSPSPARAGRGRRSGGKLRARGAASGAPLVGSTAMRRALAATAADSREETKLPRTAAAGGAPAAGSRSARRFPSSAHERNTVALGHRTQGHAAPPALPHGECEYSVPPALVAPEIRNQREEDLKSLDDRVARRAEP